MNPKTRAKLDKFPSLTTGNADFDKLVEMKQEFDAQVEKLAVCSARSEPDVNPRLREALDVSRSCAHWNRWVMDMGSGRMIEVKG